LDDPNGRWTAKKGTTDMAEPETPAKEEKSGEPEAAPKKAGAAGILPWLIPVGAAILFVVIGFGVGRVFGTRGKTQTVSAAEHASAPEPEMPPESKEAAAKGATWFYDTDPVIVNLNEPGVSRYVRMSLTLEVGNGMPDKEGTTFLDQKKPLLKHWLTLFLANQTINDLSGKNLRQVQTKILDLFNQGLFPDGKPRVVGVYFKEFSIQ
jgi:flagellar basal body-associated protein FliL